MSNVETVKTATAPRAEWVKPAVRRMEAGSAEAGGAANVDGAQGLS